MLGRGMCVGWGVCVCGGVCGVGVWSCKSMCVGRGCVCVYIYGVFVGVCCIYMEMCCWLCITPRKGLDVHYNFKYLYALHGNHGASFWALLFLYLNVRESVRKWDGLPSRCIAVHCSLCFNMFDYEATISLVKPTCTSCTGYGNEISWN